MSHINLSDLQEVLGKYTDPTQLLEAGGPFALAGIVRAFITKNKIASLALAGSTIWFAVRELSGPMMGLIQDQFGQLQGIMGSMR